MRIALVTCERPTERDTNFDFIAAALRRRGAAAEAPKWTDPGVDWSGFDLVAISSTWDYHTQPDRFRQWLAEVDAASRLRNPRDLVEWNMDKRYLSELETAGVPTIPTIWTQPGEEDSAVAAIADSGWDRVVIKPVIDLGAERLARVESTLAPRILAAMDQPGMVQPYLGSLEREGEISLVFVAGELLHGLRKLPERGDFRVQPQYGGTHEAIEPDPAAIEIARAAIAAAPAEPLHARVDLVRDDAGGLRLIELELIEPNLYIDVAPAGAERIARALLAAAA